MKDYVKQTGNGSGNRRQVLPVFESPSDTNPRRNFSKVHLGVGDIFVLGPVIKLNRV